MLIVDESGPAMTAHVQANNSGHFFQYIQSWCRNADLREAGHAIFLISKLSLNDFLERYHQDIRNFDGTDYLQTIPIHDHTEKELSRYLLMRAARQDTDPYEIQNVGNIAGMLSNHARQSDEFGIDEIETHMQNPHRWQQYLQDVASGGGFDVADLDLQGLQQHFDEKLIGQQHIKDQLVKALSRLKKYGVPKSKQNQPLFVGLFAGPTGVGKTEIARQISQYVFNRPPCHLEFNTLTSEADVYKIFGAPPGYVGYGEPTQLEQYLAAHNYGVIILDEIEKAHPTIHNQFYRVLDEGVTESTGSGQILRFGNTIILATSNAGDRIDSQNPNASREQRQTYYEQVIRDVFAPPLYGRLTKYTGSQPLIFDAFNAEQQRDIARLYLRLALKTLRNDYPKGQDFQVTASEAFWSAFVKRAGNGTGARGLEAMIETVAEQLFFGHLENRLPERVELDWHHTDFTINGDPVDLF